jgi:cell division septum initiation protein DivIVA
MSKKAVAITEVAAPAQGAATQPDATPAAASEQQNQEQAHEQAPAEPSDREKQLEADLAHVAEQLAAARSIIEAQGVSFGEQNQLLTKVQAELSDVTAERDNTQTENEQLRTELEAAEAKLVAAEQASTKPEQATTQEEPSEEDRIKSLLKRNGLKIAYMLESGPCFDADHAKHVAGEGFDSLTTISID